MDSARIAAIPFFADLPEDELAAVASVAFEVEIASGQALASPPDPFAPPEVAEGGLRTASVVATSPMRLIGLFKRDVWALDRRAPAANQRLRAMLEERRAEDARRERS
jgi:hypothetical protein